MKIFIVIVLTLSIISCGMQEEEHARFTEAQIASLQLEATKVLNVETDSATIIDLNPFLKEQPFEFGSLIKEVKLIPLETTEGSLLDAINKIVVTEANIYIFDKFKGGGIVIFNKEGKYIKRIPNGKGPGELSRLYDIDFDVSQNELVVYQHSFFLFFSPSGEFIRQQRLPFGFYNFTVIPDGYVFKTLDREGNEHLGRFKDFTLLVTDKAFKLRSIGLSYPPNQVNYGGYHYLFNNNSLLITERFVDTIYHYASEIDKLKAKYVLDYSKKKLPERFRKGTLKDFHDGTKQNDYYFYIGQYLDTEDHQIFFIENRNIIWQTIIYRDKRSGNTRGGTFPIYDARETPQIAYPQSTFGNYFISVYMKGRNDIFSTQSSTISEEDKLKIKDLTENDNPVLVFFKLTNF